MADERANVDDAMQVGLARHDNGMPPEGDVRVRIVLAILAVAVALVSFFVLGPYFSKPETYAKTVAALDKKRDTVMSLMGASTASSAAISLLPGDAGTPIAEKLVDLSSDFLIVIAAIYLEKYLLTILGVASFKLLIPVSCALFVGAIALWRNPMGKAALSRVSTKLLLFGLVISMVVPVSVKVSSMIEETYQASIDETIQTAEQTTEAIEESAEESDSTSSSSTSSTSGSSNPLSYLLNLPEELNKLTDSARSSLSNFIEALAVMIVTSCLIPILVLLFFLWMARLILGINIEIPPMHLHRRRRL